MVKYSKYSCLSIFLLVVLSLSACSWFKPSQSSANLKINSVQYLNPDINGQPAPVVLRIYQLKDISAFNQTDYYSLTNNTIDVLGSSLVDRINYQIRPNTKEKQSFFLSSNTKYLGIVGEYRNINQARWRSIIEITQGESVSININLESNGLSAKRN